MAENKERNCQNCFNLMRTLSVWNSQYDGGYCMETLEKIEYCDSIKKNKCKNFMERKQED